MPIKSPVGPAIRRWLDPLVIEVNIIEALQTVFDPDIPVNIWELGLIHGST